MVRYARSKGSKASNERRVEDPTPWIVMRNQMIAMQNKVFQKVDDSVNHVNDKRHEKKVSAIWAPIDAPENKSEKKLKKLSSLAEVCQTSVKPKSKIKKSMQNKMLHTVKDNANELNESEISANDVPNSHIIKKSKTHSFLGEDEYMKPKKKKSMQNKTLQKVEDTGNEEPNEIPISCTWVSNAHDDSNSNILKKSKKHSFIDEGECWKQKKSKSYDACKTKTESSPKMDINTLKMETNISPEVDTETSHKKRCQEHNSNTKPFWEMESNTSSTNNEWHRSESIQYGNEFKNKLKNKTPKLERKHNKLNFRERKCEYHSVEFLGGRKVELYYFDGFPVMKEDWEQLVALKEDMLKKGIPEDEMREALKLERRRAEKALSRLRKKVCFHCRESGHLLSDCPALQGFETFSSKKVGMLESANADICFKCGSTEHSYLKCKLGEKDNFKFASCFICGEQGHISRQCPQNPRGCYPKGGACRACGDVTHLRRDCPQYQQEQQQGAVTLPTLKDEAALEDLEVDTRRENISMTVKPGKKVVKF